MLELNCKKFYELVDRDKNNIWVKVWDFSDEIILTFQQLIGLPLIPRGLSISSADRTLRNENQNGCMPSSNNCVILSQNCVLHSRVLLEMLTVPASQ